MTGIVRLGYAISQWKPNFDDFTRREQHVRALKVIAACGFTGVELRGGSGRWDPLGRPASIAANYGSAAAFTDLLRQIGIEAVCSWYFDPGEPIGEELCHGRTVLETGDHGAITESVKPLAEFLAAAGGSRLVVRPLPSAWCTGEAHRRRHRHRGRGMEPGRRGHGPPRGHCLPARRLPDRRRRRQDARGPA